MSPLLQTLTDMVNFWPLVAFGLACFLCGYLLSARDKDKEIKELRQQIRTTILQQYDFLIKRITDTLEKPQRNG